MRQETENTLSSSNSSRDAAIPVDGKTLVDAFLHRVNLSPEARVYLVKRGEQFTPIHWYELYRTVRGVVAGLQKVGVQKGDRIAILSNCRPEWTAADLGVMSVGAVTIPIYQSSTADDLAYILSHSKAKLVFVENKSQVEKLQQAFAKAGTSVPMIRFEKTENSAEDWEEFTRLPIAEEAYAALIAPLKSDDIASIVYTSGTTGTPKGALLPHSCFTSELRSISKEIDLHRDDVTLTFLPFAHVLGRVESYIPIFSGITLGFAESFNAVSSNLLELKPSLMMAVPRVFEKLHSKILNEIQSAPAWNQKVFQWAERVGREGARLRAQKKNIPFTLAAKLQVADRLVFSKVRDRLGGRLRIAVSGGAPISADLCEFFHAVGIAVLEGYGLTETTAAIAVNRPEDFNFGTVGRPLAETEFRIAADGEILVRGPAIFKGYLENAQATSEVLSADGWFSTGDIGVIDERGFIKITDRKKELIVTSGGKNVAPAKLENRLKEIRYISNALVFGDKQKYLVALLTPDESEVRAWAKAHGVNGQQQPFDPKLLQEIEREVKRMNSELASYESIKRFELLPRDFTIEEGELTPSLKIKRKVCIERYRDRLESMYQ